MWTYKPKQCRIISRPVEAVAWYPPDESESARSTASAAAANAFEKHQNGRLRMRTACSPALFLLLLFCCIPVQADTINVPGDYPTIQAGINAAQNGDTVLVHPGSHYGSINFIGKNITVASLYLTTGDASYLAQTIIYGNGSSSCVKFNNNESNSAVLTGFTVTHGGAMLVSYSSPVIDHAVMYDNYSPFGGSTIQRLSLRTVRSRIMMPIMAAGFTAVIWAVSQQLPTAFFGGMTLSIIMKYGRPLLHILPPSPIRT